MTKPYRRLAEALDRLPNGFPRTDSGLEIRILKKICSPEEAALAGLLTGTPEPVEAIAARAGEPAGEVSRALFKLVRRGMVWLDKQDGEVRFRLAPFVVGIYEAQVELDGPRAGPPGGGLPRRWRCPGDHEAAAGPAPGGPGGGHRQVRGDPALRRRAGPPPRGRRPSRSTTASAGSSRSSSARSAPIRPGSASASPGASAPPGRETSPGPRRWRSWT